MVICMEIMMLVVVFLGFNEVEGVPLIAVYSPLASHVSGAHTAKTLCKIQSSTDGKDGNEQYAKKFKLRVVDVLLAQDFAMGSLNHLCLCHPHWIQ